MDSEYMVKYTAMQELVWLRDVTIAGTHIDAASPILYGQQECKILVGKPNLLQAIKAYRDHVSLGTSTCERQVSNSRTDTYIKKGYGGSRCIYESS
mmetsp:Transcript_13995/g.20935  ORF Transcript_13995/g.20935 Transcript_13995/m.20935 type:complete len:96 (+) Transcript_13995:733-1020(+)